MLRVNPGWLVAVCAAVVAVSGWLPWLTTGGGRANAIGGTVGSLDSVPARFGVGQLIVLLAAALIVAGAMAARGLSARLAAGGALAISLLLVALTGVYYSSYVVAPVSAGYGLYVGGGLSIAAALCAAWALFVALSAGRPS
ncbi:hypothetical protein H7I41_01515 [Mycobacterium manitobense]|uniref:Transmembrane protein n=1 Tax=[Mycobacterium] manitobense TaxID=190147 RepID=A0A9X2YJY8_9MYCO|nr:hypothetical protein [[Mycobacterium] manitobense]MCV7168591.1 hypothetical protein [[Mycobacterium] manitobense]